MTARDFRWKKLLLTAALLAAGAAALYLGTPREAPSKAVRVLPPPPTRPEFDASAAPLEQRSGTSASRPAPTKLAQLDPTRPVPVDLPLPKAALGERSGLADQLHEEGKTGLDDLRTVLTVFDRYRERYGGYPVGEDNAAFMRALAGRNPHGLAFIEADHRAIDAAGQLLDRWGSPYFIHLLDRNELELRSAGPDRQMYTPDDQILPSAARAAAARTAGE